MAYSMDLRLKVLTAVDRGESEASVARRFEIGERTVRRFKRLRRESGSVAPRKTGPRKPTKITEADDQVMRDAVATRPGITAMELIPMLGVTVVECTVCRRLKKLGLTLKKSR